MAGQEFVKKTKISKSKDGEKYAPDKILERNSADTIRLWSAAASLGTDVMFDEGGMGDASKFLNKLWNATRFALMNLEGFTPTDTIAFKDRHPTDRWILSRLSQVWAHYEKSLNEYETHSAKVELDKFFWMDLCDNYIELIKWRCQSSDTEDANSAKQTLYEVLFKVISLYAPYAPHITEEIYQLYFKQFVKAPSLHLCEFKATPLPAVDESALRAGRYLVGLVGLVRTYKSKNQLPFRIPMKELVLYMKQQQILFVAPIRDDVRQFAQAEIIRPVTDEAPPASAFELDFEGIKIEPVITPEAIAEAKAKKTSQA